MNLDVNTLFMVTIYVEAILGLLLLFAWVQNTSIKAVAWWGFAHLLRAASVVLFGMYGNVPDLISIDLANAMLFTAFAVTWTGARVFDGRPAEPVYMVSGAVLWLLICRLPVLAEAVEARVLIASGIITGYTWAHGVRILARPRRAAGVALAGDLHAVRARRAVPAAHAAGGGAAVVGRPIRSMAASGSRCCRSRRCCSRSRSPSSCWRWPRSAPSCATAPRPWSIR